MSRAQLIFRAGPCSTIGSAVVSDRTVGRLARMASQFDGVEGMKMAEQSWNSRGPGEDRTAVGDVVTLGGLAVCLYMQYKQ